MGIQPKAFAKPAEPGAADKPWHLSRSESERALTEFEFSLERLFQAFYRWKSECAAAAGAGPLTGNDTAILNVIRMREQPKSLSEIARLLNREDVANLQYAVRKLLGDGLVEKSAGASRKGTTYRITAKGQAVTERYAALRAQVLLSSLRALAEKPERFAEAGHFLDVMAGMYDQSAGQVSARRY